MDIGAGIFRMYFEVKYAMAQGARAETYAIENLWYQVIPHKSTNLMNNMNSVVLMISLFKNGKGDESTVGNIIGSINGYRCIDWDQDKKAIFLISDYIIWYHSFSKNIESLEPTAVV